MKITAAGGNRYRATCHSQFRAFGLLGNCASLPNKQPLVTLLIFPHLGLKDGSYEQYRYLFTLFQLVSLIIGLLLKESVWEWHTGTEPAWTGICKTFPLQLL